MPKTANDIYELFRTQLVGWNIQKIPALTPEEKTNTRVESFSAPQAAILISPDSENIVVAFSETSVTGTERPKPQIRIFMHNIINAYKYSKIKHLRFFAFVICKTDPITLKLPNGVIPDEYLVSLESSFDRCSSERIDLRSMYDTLENKLNMGYFRLSGGDHACTSIEQASFIRISDATGAVRAENLLPYLTYFDNRPYMLSTKEGMRTIYQPSKLFEKATETNSNYPWNLLVFGAPGTGKSHLIDNKLELFRDEFGSDSVVSDRVTFYSDYTYQQFVGGYMPIPKPDIQQTLEASDGTHSFSGRIVGQHISYEFIPGPMGAMLAKAFASKIKGESTKYVLVIEEINRANAANVFGDVFQLLDRDKGVSNYSISVADSFAEYLFKAVYAEMQPENPSEASKLTVENFKKIKLPENLYLWSSMNSADQGVFPLDSAFKRRWSFLYKDINTVSPENMNRPIVCLANCSDPANVHKENYDWNTLRKAINTIILQAGFDEDRCIGYWFFSQEEILSIEAHTACVVDAFYEKEDALQRLEILPNPFVDKLLSYLRQDVFRNIPTQFFKDECRTLSSIRLAINHLEVNGNKPVSLAQDVTCLTQAAFVSIPLAPPVIAEGDEV